jgi:hypothetical protein
LQRRDVAIERAQADADLFRQGGARHRPAVAPKDLDEIEKALRAGHSARVAWGGRGANAVRPTNSCLQVAFILTFVYTN